MKKNVSRITIVCREKEFEKLVEKKGSVEAADAVSSAADRWPPPKMNSKTLFELFYADKVRDAYIAREKESGAVTDSTRGTGKRFLNSRLFPVFVSNRFKKRNYKELLMSCKFLYL